MDKKRLASSFGRGLMLAGALMIMIASAFSAAVGGAAVYSMAAGETIAWGAPAALFLLAIVGFAAAFAIIDNA